MKGLVLAMICIAGAFAQAPTAMTVSAKQQKVDGNTIRLRGRVLIQAPDMTLRADEATFNRATGEIVAHGNAILRTGAAEIKGQEVRYLPPPPQPANPTPPVR